jgi:parallel beta-helix repeat protein
MQFRCAARNSVRIRAVFCRGPSGAFCERKSNCLWVNKLECANHLPDPLAPKLQSITRGLDVFLALGGIIVSHRVLPRGAYASLVAGLAGILLVSLESGRSASAATIEISPPESFENAVESLLPGDTLTVHAGTYSESGRISIGVHGTASAPVLIRGASGESSPLITRPSTSTPQNTLNLEGATYLTIQGLEISGNGDGIELTTGSRYITIADNHIHHIDVGVNFRGTMDHITVRHNHIHNTGNDGGTGEGMYVGCNNATCAVSESLIEENWIHDSFGASQGDGIEIKSGSHSNIIRDNVVYNTNYPCIILYGTSGNPRNLVEGNVLWNCGDSGIQCAADAVIRNNIILSSPGNGFNSQDHQGVTPNNLEFVHNTIVGGDPCLRLMNWGNKSGMVFANNAVYCEGGSNYVESMTGVTVTGNVVVPSVSSLPSSGFIVGRSAAQDFVDAVNRDVYPTSDSRLIDAASPSFVTAADFNGSPRSGLPDAGAYTWTGPFNPGWLPGPGFKNAATSMDVLGPAAIQDLRAQP